MDGLTNAIWNCHGDFINKHRGKNTSVWTNLDASLGLKGWIGVHGDKIFWCYGPQSCPELQ